ncbi:unnamed protein product [Brassica rapa subsp. narinosa]
MFISHEYVLFSTCTSPTKDSWYLGPTGNIIYNNKKTAIFNYECVVDSCKTDWTKPIPSILRLSSSLTLSSLSFLAIIDKFVKRYGKTKLERAIELFEHAVSMMMYVRTLYLQYAKLKEDYGLAKQAMKVYEEATKKVPECQRVEMCDIYIFRAAEIFGDRVCSLQVRLSLC